MCLGIPGEVVEIIGDDALTRMGKVSFGGVIREVCLAGVPEAEVGAYVIVHAGYALSTLDEEEANQVFDYLGEMAEVAEREAGA